MEKSIISGLHIDKMKWKSMTILLSLLIIIFLLHNETSAIQLRDLFATSLFLNVFVWFTVALLLYVNVVYFAKLNEWKIPYFLYFFLLIPVTVMPFFRCYFRVPYLFCHQCPNKCAFGHVRWFIVLSLVNLNLHKNKYCLLACGFGKMQRSMLQKILFKISKSIKKGVIGLLQFGIVVLYILSYIQKEFIVQYFGLNLYEFNWIFGSIFILGVLFSTYIYRAFCIFCPVGSIFNPGWSRK